MTIWFVVLSRGKKESPHHANNFNNFNGKISTKRMTILIDLDKFRTIDLQRGFY